MTKKVAKKNKQSESVVDISTVKRMKAPERRASIISIASVLFAEHGFNGVSVDTIAKYAKVSPAVLYQHFDSKDELYEAVLSDMAGQRVYYADIVIEGPDDFRSLLERMTLVFLENVQKSPFYLKLEMQSILETDSGKKKGNEVVQRFFESRWKCFTDVIEFHMMQLAAKNKVSKVNPSIAGLLYQGMIREALLAKCFYQSPRFKDIALPDLARQLMEMFFNAIGHEENMKCKL